MPLSSRSVLLLGGLALLCLGTAATVLLQAEAENQTPTLDAPAAEPGAPPDASDGPRAAPASIREAATEPAPTPAPSAVHPMVEATPVPDSTLPALERAATGPVDAEVRLLLTALQTGFSTRSAEIEPSLRPYLAHVVGRLRVNPASFAVTVSAPDAALAARRADVLRAAVASGGLAPDRFSFTAATGPHALTLAP